MSTPSTTICEILSRRADIHPDKPAFVFLREGVPVTLSYGELHQQARSLATALLAAADVGDRALLCYPPGLDFVRAFFACAYAGVVAVPLYPPHVRRGKDERIANVVDSCDAHLLLSISGERTSFNSLQESSESLAACKVLFTDDDEMYLQPLVQSVRRSAPAYLQFTSGSTSAPKGVIISHANIIANLRALESAGAVVSGDVFVNWLPLFHDLGLVNTVLLPVFAGSTSVLIAPARFIQNPRSWLQAISEYGGSICGGPNFSYDLCVERVAGRDLEGLDLSAWRNAFNAGEPVRAATLERFASAFARVGFRKSALYPCYGLAEATVFATGGRPDDGPVVGHFDAEALTTGRAVAAPEGGSAVALPGCGWVQQEHELRIVDPKTRIEQRDGTVGEIWLYGPSISHGYWGLPEHSEECFGARLAGSDQPWLRTGDLGFVRKETLYVSGRMKELIILHGRNYQPVDIEETVQNAHATLRAGGGVAFSIEAEGGERLVVLQEVRRSAVRSLDPHEVAEAILERVAADLQVSVFAVLLMKPGSLPRTSSGKLRRRFCKEQFLRNQLTCLHRHDVPARRASQLAESPTNDAERVVAEVLRNALKLEELSLDEDVFALGADSISLMRAAVLLGQAFRMDLPVSTVFEKRTVRALAAALPAPSQLDGAREARVIPMTDRSEVLPLSFSQQRLWALWQIEGSNAVYNECRALRIDGDLDSVAALEALRRVVVRHEALRTRIVDRNGQPCQQIEGNFAVPQSSEAVRDERHLESVIEQEAQYRFDLGREVPVRFRLLRLSIQQHYLVMTAHHIAVDGWSMGILLQEFSALYSGIVAQRATVLPALPVQYADFARWQRERLATPAMQQHLSYWRRQLHAAPQLHSLPLTAIRPVEQSFAGAVHRQVLPRALDEAMRVIAREHGVTQYVVLQAAFAVLVGRFSNNTDVLIGSAISGRIHPAIEPLIGFFVNDLAIRHDLSGNPSFSDFLERAKKVVLEAFDHQEVPFERLVEILNPARALSHNPIIQIKLDMELGNEAMPSLQGLTVTPLERTTGYSRYDLYLRLRRVKNELHLEWHYATALFSSVELEHMADCFATLLNSIAADRKCTIQRLRLLPEADRRRILTEWNNTAAPYPRDRCIHELIEEQAANFPDRTAVVCGGHRLTYAALNRHANQVAHYLIGLGVSSEAPVALCLENSIELVIGILGALKAGGAYVPIDPAYPPARVDYLLRHSDAKVVLTQSELLSWLPAGSFRVVPLDEPVRTSLLGSQPFENPGRGESRVSPDSLAYIIFTSGSTGVPKGVLVSHASLVNSTVARDAVYPSAIINYLLLSSVAFDSSVAGIFWTLTRGGKLCLSASSDRIDLREIERVLESEEITHFLAVPSVYKLILRSGMPAPAVLRTVIVAGDTCEPELVALHRGSEAWGSRTLSNEYGPTEACVWSSAFDCAGYAGEGAVPIGMPIQNVQLHVLNELLEPQPIGAFGELYIGGVGVARGYLNDPQLTRECFVADPSGCAGSRLYRTGDLVRWRADGNLEFRGRVDHQSKVRGYRVDCSEIESHLARVDSVAGCVVVTREIPGRERQLVAYVVRSSPLHDDDDDAARRGEWVNTYRVALSAQLPDYMVPTIYVHLPQLPLSANGKVDRSVLPPPNEADLRTELYVAPATPTEAALAAVWSEVLKLDRVGTHDGFFALGGDSIQAIQVVARARRVGLNLSVRQIFANQRIIDLARVARMEEPAEYSSDSPPVEGSQLLLPIQREFFARSFPDPAHYNQAVMLTTPVGFGETQLRALLIALYERHAALRLRFRLCELDSRGCAGRPVAWEAFYEPFVSEMIEQTFLTHDLSILSSKDRRARLEGLCTEAHRSLNLRDGPLFKAVHFNFGGDEGRLLLVVHHLAIDAVSWRVLLNDMHELYAQLADGKSSGPAQGRTSLQRWGQALHDYAQSDALRSERGFWLRQLAPISAEKPLAATRSNRYRSVDWALTEAQTQSLIGPCNRPYATNLNELLLTVVVRAHSKWRGVRELCVQLEAHGRESLFPDLDVGETVGWFTALYPLHLEVEPDQDVKVSICEIKERIRSVPNKGLGFGVLTEVAGDEELRQAAVAAGVPALLFNYLGQLDSPVPAESPFQLARESTGSWISARNTPAELSAVNARIVEKRLSWTFSTAASTAAVERFRALLDSSVQELIDHCLAAHRHYTPSDFPLAQLDAAELTDLQRQYPEIANVYRATPMQQGMLFHSVLDGSGATYTTQVYCNFIGPMDAEIFERAWQHLVARHDVLRTCFIGVGTSSIQQLVLTHAKMPFERCDWSNESQQPDCARRLAEFRTHDREKGFDFARAPLMRATLIRLGSHCHHFVWSHHHALLDGWCTPILVGELLSVYAALHDRSPICLPEPQPFAHFIGWLDRRDADLARAYWKEYLADFAIPTLLGAPRTSDDHRPLSISRAKVVLSDAVSARLAAFARSQACTMNVLLEAAWAYLLHRRCGEPDVVFGVTISGRSPEIVGIERMIGLFINTVPVRTRFADDLRVGDLIAALHSSNAARDQHATRPLWEIQTLCGASPTIGLFDTLLVFENYPAQELLAQHEIYRNSEIQLESPGSDEQSSFALTLAVRQREQLSIDAMYQTNSFRAEEIEGILDQFVNVLAELSQSEKQRLIADVRLQSVESERSFLERQRTQHHPAAPACLHELFEEQVRRSPTALAVVYAGQKLTYSELNRRANQIAHDLVASGVRSESRVGLCIEPSTELIAAILGILKASAAYVPLDPNYPAARLGHMVRESGVSRILGTKHALQSLSELTDIEMLALDSDEIRERLAASPVFDVTDLEASPGVLAYIIYTSGSSGQPKGVMVSHDNVRQLFASCEEQMAFSSSDVWTLFHSCAFDFSVWEIWGALLHGGCLVVVPREVRRDPELFVKLIRSEAVTVLSQTPAAFYPLLDRLPHVAGEWSLRAIVFGGEALDFGKLRRWFRHEQSHHTRLVNMYGITETTVHVTHHAVASEDTGAGRSIIGRGLKNWPVYICDDSMQIQPAGVPGQIYVGGYGVARGYSRQPRLTAERFVPDPYGQSGSRLYRTGDRARYRADGTLEYLGRLDRQVKIRGYRIECDEIEAQIGRLIGVRDCVVVPMRAAGGENQLVAYVVRCDSVDAAEPTKESGREQVAAYKCALHDRLPHYMVPEIYVHLPGMPLTANGKVDRKALPEPDDDDRVRETYAAPRNAVESALCLILEEVLGLGRVGIHDNFFSLGGDSILSLQVLSKARAAGLSFELRNLFRSPTPHQLAQFVLKTGDVTAARAVIGKFAMLSAEQRAAFANRPDVEDAYPLAALQAGMYFHTERDRDAALYCDVQSVKVDGEFEESAFQRSLEGLVARHPALRTSVCIAGDGQLLQLVHTGVETQVVVHDLCAQDPVTQERLLAAWLLDEQRRGFSWSDGSLFRVFIHRLSPRQFRYTLSFHHIILDGWSVAALQTELFADFLTLRDGNPVTRQPPRTQMRDFIALELQTLELLPHREYWRNLLEGSIPLELPVLPEARSRRRRQRFSTFNTALDAGLLRDLQLQAAAASVPVKSLLLAAYVKVIGMVGGRCDVLTGMVMNGRPEEEDAEKALGLFLNSVPLRVRLADQSWRDLATQIHRLETEMLSYRRYPLQAMQRERGGEPLFDTLFNFVHFHRYREVLDTHALHFGEVYSAEPTNLGLVVNFHIDAQKGTLLLSIVYDEAALDGRQVAHIAAYHVNALRQIASSPDSPHSFVSLLDENERQHILTTTHSEAADASVASLHAGFEAQVSRTPDANAIVFGEQRLSYRELSERSNRLAHLLASQGVEQDQRIGLCFDRTPEMLVAILGVLKAGCAYVPLDPGYPSARLEYVMKDAGVSVLLCQVRTLESIPQANVTSIALDAPETMKRLAECSKFGLEGAKSSASNLAYVIYTSGSTGHPKGVMVAHESVLELVQSCHERFQFSTSDVWTLFHSYAFDFSVWELWGALLYGGTAVVVPQEVARDGHQFASLLAERGVTVLSQTPSAFYQLLECIPSNTAEWKIRVVVFGGEALDPRRLGPWFVRGISEQALLVNMYGITETTVHVTYREITREDARFAASLIGRGLRGWEVCVCDEWLQLQPVGAAGELIIGGVGVTRGYLGKPGLTGERFIPDPRGATTGARAYRSGDRGRLLPDGTFEYLGRLDQQVKIHGFRIECSEIESTLAGLEHVKNCSVIARDDVGPERCLVAYVVAQRRFDGESVEDPRSREHFVAQLRATLSSSLPVYMVPHIYVVLARLPLTANGKVDRAALPAPAEDDLHVREYVAPANETEAILCGIWQDVLGRRRISTRDSFFALGGDSISSIQVLARARAVGIDFELEALFREPTVERLSIASVRPASAASRVPDIEPFGLLSESERIEFQQDRDTEDAYPLSDLQAGMYYHGELSPESALYHDVFTYRLEGRFVEAPFQKAAERLAARHPILRTSFAQGADGRLLQRVHAHVKLISQVEDLSGLPSADQEIAISSWIASELKHGFNWSTAPLLRMCVHRLGPERFQYTVSFQHAVLDGWSLATLQSELFDDYAILLSGLDRQPQPPSSLYRNFVAAEVLALQSQESRAYWRRVIDGAALLALPAQQGVVDRSGVRRVSMFEKSLDVALGKRLTERAAEFGVALKSLLLAAHARVMCFVCGQDDALLGTASSSRLEEVDGERVLGLFLNSLPLRVKLEGRTWRDLVLAIHRDERERTMHRRYPLRAIQQMQSGRKLFDVLFNFVHFHVYRGLVSSDTVRMIGGRGYERTDLPLVVTFQQIPGESVLQLSVAYDERVLSGDQIERWSGYYERALLALASDPDARVDAAGLLTKAEREQAVYQGNDTDAPYEDDASIQELFELRARENPDGVALIHGNIRLTYRELDRNANRLASWLVANGAGPEVAIGVCIERSIDMVVAIVAILKAGSMYLPLDPSFPPHRLEIMVRKAGARLVLTQRSLQGQLPRDITSMFVAELGAEFAAHDDVAPKPRSGPLNAAYVMYTSGSTGQPKGICTTHRNVVRLVRNTNYVRLEPGDVVAQLSPLAFDGSTFEIWGALLNGATLVLIDRDISTSPFALRALLLESHVNTLFVTTALFNRLIQECPDIFATLRDVLFGGEAVDARSVRSALGEYAPRRLLHVYGPTEATTYSTWMQVESVADLTRTVPIGSAISNCRVYVLDKELAVAPVDAPGELYIGGSGLARGYLAEAASTAARFVPDPFGPLPGERLYRTGDIVRRRSDGHIEFLGRADTQVKIRGFRIECAEIESQLLKLPEVQECAVVAREDAEGERRLVAYVVLKTTQVSDGPRPGEATDGARARRLRSALSALVPDYLVPKVFLFMARLPLNSVGKIDRKSLPMPAEADLQKSDYLAPRNETESKLCVVWSEVLRVASVGVDDNFFALGGDSIVSIQLVARARREGLHFSVRQLFETQTVALLASRVELKYEKERQADASVGPMPLLPIQQSFFERNYPEPHHFNQAVLLRTPAGFTCEKLERIVAALYETHDALRLRFPHSESVRVGIFEPFTAGMLAGSMGRHDLHFVAADERADRMRELCNQIQRSLDLENGPTFRAVFFETGEPTGRLLLVMHHLITDGVSWRILLRDMETACSQLDNGRDISLVACGMTLQQWAACLHAHATSSSMSAERGYWLGQLEDTRDFPNVVAREASQESVDVAATREFEISVEQTQLLLTTCNKPYRTRTEELLLAALAYAYEQWLGRSELPLRFESHGREELGGAGSPDETVGWLTSVYPQLLRMQPGGGLQQWIVEAKELCRKVPKRGLGFGVLKEIIRDLEIRQKDRVCEEAAVVFNYLGQFGLSLGEGALFPMASESPGTSVSPLNPQRELLGITAVVLGTRLRVLVSASEVRVPVARLDRFIELLQAAVESCVQHCLEAKGAWTVADFPASHFTQKNLMRLQADYPELQNLYIATPMQAGMQFHGVRDGEGSYTSQYCCDLVGDLDIHALERAWQQVISRHDVLKTCFVPSDEGELHQVVLANVHMPLPLHDWRRKSPTEYRKDLVQLRSADKAAGFLWERAPLMRAMLVRIEDNRYHFVWIHHHMLLDGWCGPVIVDELMRCYRAFAKGATPALSEVISYEKYICWLHAQDKAKAREFWAQYLKDATAQTPLVLNRASLKSPRTTSARSRFRLPAHSHERLTERARSLQCTPNVIVQAAWAYVLHRLSGEQSVVVGTTISGRPAEITGIERMVGLLINSVPSRVQFAEGLSIRELLHQVHEDNIGREEFGYLPLWEIQALSGIARGEALFESLITFENYPQEWSAVAAASDAIRIENESRDEQNHYALTIIVEDHGTLDFSVWYWQELFTDEVIEQFVTHLQQALTILSQADPEASIAQLDLLTPTERHQQLIDWNNTACRRGDSRLVHELIEEQVLATPHAIAVTHERETLTYAELDARANQLARYLIEKGVASDSLVGLCAERGIEMIVGIVGILKAGGAYVPLDPTYPAVRLSYMLSQSKIAIVVGQERVLGRLPSNSALEIALDSREVQQLLQRFDVAAPAKASIDGGSLAYVIFTSGTTGHPKGACISHKALLNRLQWMQAEYGLTREDRVLQKTPYSFDVSVWELLWPLLTGARLVFARSEGHKDPGYLYDLIRAEQITVLHFVPTMLAQMLAAVDWSGCATVRHVFCSGEALSRELAERFFRSGTSAQLHNLYGPTEAAIDVSYCDCRNYLMAQAIPIGRPIENLQLYVLNSHLQLQPIGVAGELYIGGVGLARGYLDQPSLTAEVFVPNPHATEPGDRLYRTGDLARFWPDGNIEYLGRVDHQVKIRGIRIECGEIESVLMLHPSVAAAVVVPHGEDIDKKLVAYACPTQELLEGDETDGNGDAVQAWTAVFNEAYIGGVGRIANDFDISGWNSSYTGLAHYADEMHEWVDSTVGQIATLKPRRLLEVGCGTGLLLLRLAADCEEVHALDISATALEGLGAELRRRGMGHVQLHQGDASAVGPFAAQSFDTVIVNSVAQYFPSGKYLKDALAALLDLLVDGGALFIGDVRNLDLLPAHTARTIWHRMGAADWTVNSFARQVERTARLEQELLVSPAFFATLGRRNSQVSRVDIMLKRGTSDNEMLNYRYDVVIRKGSAPANKPAVVWYKWTDESTLHAVLKEVRHAAFGISGVSNSRVTSDVALLAGLHEWSGEARIRECYSPPPDAERGGAQLARLLDTGVPFGYRAHATWSQEHANAVDLIFWRGAMPVIEACLPYSESRFFSYPQLTLLERRIVPQLLDHLKAQLPPFMLPSAIVLLERLPSTPNGKLDRRTLYAPEAVAGDSSSQALPRNDREATLCRVWSDVLKIERVGIYDDFFALGGDSILSIQAANRARQAGIHFTVRELFEHRTVAALALVARESKTISAVQDPVEGQLQLLPIQQDFLERAYSDPNHFNQTILLETPEGFTLEMLSRIVAALYVRHDSFRLRFVRGSIEDGSEPRAHYQPYDDAMREQSIVSRDLSSLSEDARRGRLEAYCEDLQSTLDLGSGPVFKTAFFDFGAQPGRLLLVAHHLVIDAVSWRIVLADIETAWRQLTRGIAVMLSAKGTSLQKWSESLHRLAAEREILEQRAYWLSQCGPAPLLKSTVLSPQRNLGQPELQTLSFEIDAETTDSLLKDSHDAFRTQGHELLLAAVLNAWRQWASEHTLCLEVEWHGRESLFAGHEFGETVGWFTATYPLRLVAPASSDFGALICTTKEACRAVPQSGIGYGLLVEIARDPALRKCHVESHDRRIVFNYLGQLDGVLPSSAAFRWARENAGAAIGKRNIPPEPLGINAFVLNSRLAFTLNWRSDRFEPEAIVRLVDALRGSLIECAKHCQRVNEDKHAHRIARAIVVTDAETLARDGVDV